METFEKERFEFLFYLISTLETSSQQTETRPHPSESKNLRMVEMILHFAY